MWSGGPDDTFVCFSLHKIGNKIVTTAGRAQKEQHSRHSFSLGDSGWLVIVRTHKK